MATEAENFSSTSEIETLRSIYVDELEVNYSDNCPCSLSLWLHPSTADKLDEQYVRVYLKFSLPKEYPETVPEISMHNSRGLSDEQIDRISKKLKSIAEAHIGSAMLFELIEVAKEQLTKENRPSEDCAICLYGFCDDDIFTKTECYHYFHSHCLSRYLKSLNTEPDPSEPSTSSTPDIDSTPLCPVCRLPISFSCETDKYPEPVCVTKAEVTFTNNQQRLDEREELYQRQLSKGGIINLEAEKNRFLLEIANVPTDTTIDMQVAKVISEKFAEKISSNESNEPQSEVNEPQSEVSEPQSEVSVPQSEVSVPPKEIKIEDSPKKKEKPRFKNQHGHNSNYNNMPFYREGQKFRGGQRPHRSYRQFNDKPRRSHEKDSEEKKESQVITENDQEKPCNGAATQAEATVEKSKDQRQNFNRPRSQNKQRYPNRRPNQYGGNRPKNQTVPNDTPKDVTVSEKDNHEKKDRHLLVEESKKDHDLEKDNHEPDESRNSRNVLQRRGYRNRNDNRWDYNQNRQFNGQRNYGPRNQRNKPEVSQPQPQPSLAVEGEEARNTTSNHSGSHPRPYKSQQDRYRNGRDNRNQYGGYAHRQASNYRYQGSNRNNRNGHNLFQEDHSTHREEQLDIEINKSCPIDKPKPLMKETSGDLQEKPIGSNISCLRQPPGFANPAKRVVYGLPSANPPPGFGSS